MKDPTFTVFLVHHSHTDIGYTDLQENTLDLQTDNLKTVLSLLRQPENREFRWNCETLFLVERFLREASEEEKNAFFSFVNSGHIGISWNYLNFTDLAEPAVLKTRLQALRKMFEANGVRTGGTAMCADINGVSMGYRNTLLDLGVRFLYSNSNPTHGMPPFGTAHKPFRWKSADGRTLFVWSAGHYMLGNALGFRHESRSNDFFAQFVGRNHSADPAENLHRNLNLYLSDLTAKGYPCSFLPVSVSGCFADNAPADIGILRTVEDYRERYGKEDGIEIRMVTVDELYRSVSSVLDGAEEVTGDFSDWWADGVGSTPLATRHYRNAARQYRQALALAPDAPDRWGDICREAETHLLLYAEHTWGHSGSVSAPASGIAGDLLLRKQSYASRAGEMTSLLLNRIRKEYGGKFRYYRDSGRLRVIRPAEDGGIQPVSFEIESSSASHILVKNENGEPLPTQCRPTERGTEVIFLDPHGKGREQTYTFSPAAEPDPPQNVLRTENGIETADFLLQWEIGKGFTRFTDKTRQKELLSAANADLLCPIHESTPLPNGVMGERALLGLNIRGRNAVETPGVLRSAGFAATGPLFTDILFRYDLAGCKSCRMTLSVWHTLPRIDVTLHIGKELCEEIEGLFLPLTLHLPDAALWARKGGTEAFLPGVEQIRGTCMDYIVSDCGLLYQTGESFDYAVTAPDTPLFAFAPFRHHETVGCDRKPENNRRPFRSWIMNNKWETNFPLSLAGYYEFRYRIEAVHALPPDESFDRTENRLLPPFVCITGE